jgi:hypothetical protein
MGLRLFCEYLDAIAYISVGGADTQTLGKLTVTAAEGSETGKTKISVKEQLMSMKNCWKYKDAASATAVKYGDDVKNWSKWMENPKSHLQQPITSRWLSVIRTIKQSVLAM